MRILIADDHPLTLMGTTSFVEGLGHLVEDLCSNGITAFNLINSNQPDIAILDIHMPGMDGLEILEKLSTQKVRTRIILLTMHKEMTICNKAKQLGVKGYVLKENAREELARCIDEVAQGNLYISPTLEAGLQINHSESADDLRNKLTFSERKVLELIKEQKTSRQIAEMLFISEKTVEFHRTNIIQKLDLPRGKNSLLIWAMKYLKEE